MAHTSEKLAENLLKVNNEIMKMPTHLTRRRPEWLFHHNFKLRRNSSELFVTVLECEISNVPLYSS